MCAKRKAAEKKTILFSDEFYSDMDAEGMLHAAIVQSPFSYGNITSIDFAENTKIPSGYELFSEKDLGENATVNILGTEIPLLSNGKIEYKGQPVAVLVGEKKEILDEIKSSVRITIDKNTPKENTPVEQSIASLRSSIENFSSQKEIIAERNFCVGEPEKVFSNQDDTTIINGNWNTKFKFCSNKETEGAFCYVRGGNLHVFTPTQWISNLRQIVSLVTGFPKEKIILTRTRISVKTTNSLWENGIFACLASILAIKTGKPVKLSLSRAEHENLIETSPEVKISHKTAVDKSGIITAMDISMEFSTGAFNPFAQEILDRLAIAAPGIYNCKDIRLNAKIYKTHTTPCSFQLSMIDAAAFYAIENQIQKIAEETGFSPVELRQMNKSGGLQKMTSPFLYSFGRASDAINAAAIRSDFKRKYTVSKLAEHGRYEEADNTPYAPPLRGIAMACAFDGSGYMGPIFEKSTVSMQVSVNEEKKIIINAYPPSNAIREIWTKLIIENLDVERRSIIFTNETSDNSEKKSQASVSIPDTLVGTVSIKTILLIKCIDSIKRKKINGTPFSVKKTLNSMRKKLWNQEEFSGSPYYNTAFGTCTLELELDRLTYRETIRKICVIIDGGKILNPKAAENAIHRSIQRCLSMLVEDEVFHCPKISVQFTQSEEEPKQIGHLVYSIIPAAYASALSQALATQVSSLPLKIDSIYNMTEAQK